MTRERTLKVLEMFLDKQCSLERTLNHMDTTDVEIWDAVHTATKALSTEPCEDAISRDYLLAIANTDEAYGYVSAHDIAKAPPVTPKQRIGHWVKISPAGIYECSECGQNVMTGDIDAYRHCNGCGAKMEVEDAPND